MKNSSNGIFTPENLRNSMANQANQQILSSLNARERESLFSTMAKIVSAIGGEILKKPGNWR